MNPSESVKQRPGRSHQSVVSMQAIHKSTMEKQARYRQERKASLMPAHHYIFEVLAVVLGLEVSAVEDLILDAPSHNAKKRKATKAERK
ncbi:dynein axonemal heavy chain 8-like isoform X2 [Trichomycterus rosablanca]